MAIYTNYGRYLKAKLFKQLLDEDGETYMLFGIGNHLWDKQQEIPIAPYNTKIIADSEVTNNQFADSNANQWFTTADTDDEGHPTIQWVNDGVPVSDIAKALKSQMPPFPCIWQHYENDDTLISETEGAPEGHAITRNNYQNYYVVSNGTTYDWFEAGNNSPFAQNQPPITSVDDDSPAAQYFAELNLRGDSLRHHTLYLNSGVIPAAPVGLLGAIKCSVDFVKDIGVEDHTTYSGRANQFFYGDRYWEIISPDETLFEDMDDNDLPHHLIITSTVNPRNLNEILKIDQNIVPRQIAIYYRPKHTHENSETHEIIKDAGEPFYRVHKNLFNFGQYDITHDFLATPGEGAGEILNFNPRYSVTEDDETTIYDGGEFKFLLTDYIKGSVGEDKHAIDRFGYVIGF